MGEITIKSLTLSGLLLSSLHHIILKQKLRSSTACVVEKSIDGAEQNRCLTTTTCWQHSWTVEKRNGTKCLRELWDDRHSPTNLSDPVDISNITRLADISCLVIFLLFNFLCKTCVFTYLFDEINRVSLLSKQDNLVALYLDRQSINENHRHQLWQIDVAIEKKTRSFLNSYKSWSL